MNSIISLLFVIAVINILLFVAFGVIIVEIKKDIKIIKGILNYRM